MCCSVLQCVAICFCVTQQHAEGRQGATPEGCGVLPYVAVCCSVLQCVAECCTLSQSIAVCCSLLQSVEGEEGGRQGAIPESKTTTLQHTATLQHAATHCSTLKHSATLCNTLQNTETWPIAREAPTRPTYRSEGRVTIGTPAHNKSAAVVCALNFGVSN